MTTEQTDEHSLQAILALRQQAEEARHRRLVVLSGERGWGEGLAQMAVTRLGVSHALWLSDRAPDTETSAAIETLPAKKAMRHLGSEQQLIIMDAFAGLHPDGLGAISGTLKAGGLFLLLAPPLDQWAAYDDPDYERITSLPHSRQTLRRRFIDRIITAIRLANDCLLIEHGCQAVSTAHSTPSEVLSEERLTVPCETGPTNNTTCLAECLTEDQQQAVEAVCHVVTGHRRRPLVLTSDRGRGKSATLGIAAARLLSQGAKRILITAPYPEAVESAFARLEALLPQGERHGLVFYYPHQSQHQDQYQNQEQPRVEFIAPDQLIATSPDADLVMVDEAAAIPAPMLETLLRRYSRIVFASTIHGYEGTGRGFAVRFSKVLDQLTPQWRALHLKMPIRWSDNDPLEQFIFDTLLLNATPLEPKRPESITRAQLTFRWLDRETLSQDNALLNSVFGLLVLAHYRTSPDDLRMLLDGPSTRVAALYYQSQIVAVALVCREGGLDRALGDLIWQGRRRPRGHLIPQALASFSGLKEATDLLGERIMRIAVHPAIHRLGLGSMLVDAIKQSAESDKLDYVGASFGATADLLAFWRSAGFTPLRLGLQREAASGVHSVIVMAPLSKVGVTLCEQARGRFQEQFLFDLRGAFRDVEIALVQQLLLSTHEFNQPLSEQDRLDLEAFADHQRIYESASLAVWKLVLLALQTGQLAIRCNETEAAVLVRRVIQNHPPEEVVAELHLTGKKTLNTLLQSATRALLP